MLKRSQKYTSTLSSYELSMIAIVLKLIDLADKTIYYKEFFYVYLDKKQYTLEEISYILCVSLNSLKRHLNKIVNIIQHKELVMQIFEDL